MWGIAVVVWLYTTLVLQNLWNWFAVDALNAPHISYWTMYGLMMLVGPVSEKETFTSEAKERRMSIALSACMPAEKRAAANEEL